MAKPDRRLDGTQTGDEHGDVSSNQPSARREVDVIGQPGSSPRPKIVEAPGLDRPALEWFYRRVLVPSFDAAELVTLDELCRGCLATDHEPGAFVVIDGRPVAGLLAERFPASGVLLVSYLAVHQSYRGRGYGGLLLAEMLPKWQASWQPSIVIAEIGDPRFHAASDETGDPFARVRFWARAGAQLLAMPYFQPALRPGSPRVPDMLLIAFTETEESVPGEVVYRFLHEYFAACEGQRACTDPAVHALLDWTRRDGGRVPLWPVERFRDLPSIVCQEERR